jgi:hypothetical protein
MSDAAPKRRWSYSLLTKPEFLNTFCEPMRRLGQDESYRPVPLKAYVEECISTLRLATSPDDIEIHHVYLAGDKRHTHVLFHFGERNRFLVIVVRHDPDSIMGHYLLDLNQEYGLKAE